MNKLNVVVEVDKIRIKNVATKVGKLIDILTRGKTNAEEVGRKIDKITGNITIKWEKSE